MSDLFNLGVLRASTRLDGVPRYGKGRPGQKSSFAHRLGSNEAPDPLKEDVLAAVTSALRDGNRYPDLRGETVSMALAAIHGLQPDEVTVGAGSIVLLDQLIRAFCDHGDEVVAPWPSYEAYPILAGISGARLIRVPLDRDHRLSPAALLAEIGSRCRVIILCNPNNPTGTALAEEEIDELLAAIPRDVLIILDEAYVDYSVAPDEAASSPGRRLRKHTNLAILRTFSKAWGLAGFRAGYCLSNRSVIDALHAVAPPFPLPGVTLAAVMALLSRPQLVQARVEQNAAQRSKLTDELRSMGIPVADSRANFIWLPVGERATELATHFTAASVAVRCFDGEGVRITSGTSDDTAAVLATAATWR